MIFKRNFKMKKLLVPILAFSAVLGLDAATIEKVVVRQQWPWSTSVKVECTLVDVTSPVDLAIEVYNGANKIDPALVESALSDERFAIKDGGVKTFYIDPVKVCGAAKASIPSRAASAA